MESEYEVLKDYIEAEHVSSEVIADNAIFTLVSTGQQWRGREEIQGMLDYFYRGAFTAQAVTKCLFAGQGHGCLEAEFVGTHTGEFAGVPATGKAVNVPMTVIYEIREGIITSGHIYFDLPALMAQIGTQSTQAVTD